MCGLKVAKVHEQPFGAAKDHVQPLAALDSFLPNGKKDSDLTPFIIRDLLLNTTEEYKIDCKYKYFMS